MGLDLTSVPGGENRGSLRQADNIVLRNNGSRAKKPGIVRLDYIGNDDANLRGICDFHGISVSTRFQEVVRVINGRLEALRDGEFSDLGTTDIADSDAVSFTQFANAQIVFFENRAPVYFLHSAAPAILPIPGSHQGVPPRFGRIVKSRLAYAGRLNRPHSLTLSAPNSISDYTLLGGGYSITVADGDGDPYGITGISPEFRGDFYVFKWGKIYRLYWSGYGFGIDQITDELGAVNHNTIIETPNDIIFVSDRGIHSLSMTASYGAAEEATLTYPIYEDFIADVNWSNSKYMWACYDSETNCYLLNYSSSGSSSNNKIIGINTRTKQIFLWDDIEYSGICRYLDENKKRRTLVCDSTGQTGYLDKRFYTAFDEKITSEILSALIFPRGHLSGVCNFTKFKLYMKPTTRDVNVEFGYYIDGVFQESDTFNTNGSGEGMLIGGDEATESNIGTTVIRSNHTDFLGHEIEIRGTGSSFQFYLKQEPEDDDETFEQPFEVFGYEIEYDYSEDTGVDVKI